MGIYTVHRARRRWLLLGVATFVSPYSGGQGLAQTVAPSVDGTEAAPPSGPASSNAAPNAASGGALNEIVVTATRKAESVQRVPISIRALSTEKLEERQVTNFAYYANLLPSVSFSTLGPGRSQPFFRGISGEGFGTQSTVGTYLDEIPITTAGRQPDVHIYDVERVEALSGPQGTLFGSSSLSGTLRIITNKSSTTGFAAGYNVEANKYGAGDFGTVDEDFVNLPATDNLAIRLMGYYQHDGGYIDNRPTSLTYAPGSGLIAATSK